MGSQANVQSVESLKDFRVAMAMCGEDMLAALGAAEAELRRTLQWIQQERPGYWQDQIKRRREHAAEARAELFRRKIQKTADNNPAMSEQKENLRRAEAAVIEAEKRLALVRKWQPLLRQAALEYHGSVQRLKDLSAADIPSAVNLLTRLIDSLEAYLRVAPPSVDSSAGLSGESVGIRASMRADDFTTMAATAMDEQQAIDAARPAETSGAGSGNIPDDRTLAAPDAVNSGEIPQNGSNNRETI
jgi:hypothetical protein